MDTLTALTTKTVETRVCMKGLGKKNAVVEGRERKRPSASKVGVPTAQVKRLVLMRVPIKRSIGARRERHSYAWDRRC